MKITDDNIAKFLRMYRPGQIIYHEAVQRNLKLSFTETDDILEKLTERGLVEKCFDIRCPVCNRLMGYISKTSTKPSEEVNCPHCDNEIKNPGRYTVTVYKNLGGESPPLQGCG